MTYRGPASPTHARIYRVLQLALICWGCQDSAQAPGPTPSAATGSSEAQHAGISPALQPPTARYEPLTQPEHSSLLAAPAQVQLAPSAHHEANILNRGQVLQTWVREGQQVTAGQPLVELRVPELVLAATAAHSLQQQYAAHSRRLKALLKLSSTGLTKQETTFALQAKVADLRAQQEAAEATLRAAGIEPKAADQLRRQGTLVLQAANAGVITGLHAAPGATYEPFSDPPLVDILGTGEVWIRSELTRAPPADSTVVFEAVDGRVLPLEADPVSVTATTGGGFQVYYRARAQAASPPGKDPPGAPRASNDWLDGLMGRVRYTPQHDDRFQLPSTAIFQGERQTMVTVLRNDQDVQIPVTLIARDGASALVCGALRPDDRVKTPAGPPQTVNPPRSSQPSKGAKP